MILSLDGDKGLSSSGDADISELVGVKGDAEGVSGDADGVTTEGGDGV